MSVIFIITFLGGIIELSLQTMTFIQIKFAELELFEEKRYIGKVIEVKIRQLYTTICLKHFPQKK